MSRPRPPGADVRAGGAATGLDPVLMVDDAVTSVPVEENGDELLDVMAILERARLDSRCHDEVGTYRLVRRGGVAQRLAYAESLLPDEASLLIVECYRPPVLQAGYFDQEVVRQQALHPDWPTAELRRAASRYVSPPQVAPHSAGAAVDLTLCSSDGTEWDMGTRLNADPEESDGRCYTRAMVSELARSNRDLLAAVLAAAGLVNYPTEWWHWSFGDRYWAQAVGAPAAIHGPTS